MTPPPQRHGASAPVVRIGLALGVLAAVAPGGCRRDRDDEGPERRRSEEAALRSLPYLNVTTGEADPSKSGVTIHHRAAAHPGLNLYADQSRLAILMDMNGKPIHRWTMPFPAHWEYAVLRPRGELLAVGQGKALARLGPDSAVRWLFEENVHHDVEPTPGGELLVPYAFREMYRGVPAVFDGIVTLSAAGQPLRRWSTLDHLDALRALHPPGLLEKPLEQIKRELGFQEHGDYLLDYYHLNAIRVLPSTGLGSRDARFRPGNWLICLRQANLLVIMDRDTRAVVWHWGPGVLDWPHHPTLLPTGRILVFDNGRRRGYSRVIEVDPVSGRVEWTYRGDPPASFFSAYEGAAQRLANGNTLITDSRSGRAFEVTRDGKVVWEFFNPEIRKGKRVLIYRLLRYPLDAFPGGGPPPPPALRRHPPR